MKRAIVPRSRSGVSLLEVLVSVFVLSVGLLGVASLLPMGRYKAFEATKANRVGVCGRSAMREIMVRGWLDPEKWVAMNFFGRYDPSALPPGPISPLERWLPVPIDVPLSAMGERGIPFKDSFAIDPLFIESRSKDSRDPNFDPLVDYDNRVGIWGRRTAGFPLHTEGTLGFLRDPISDPWQVTSLRRVMINFSPWATRPLAVVEDIFTWHDDQIFSLPEDPEERPRQIALWDDGNGNVVPGGSATASVLKRLAEGNYSWMATVTPILASDDFSAPIAPPSSASTPAGPFPPFPPDPPFQPNTSTPLRYSLTGRIAGYEVSVVVFYKRNFECPRRIDDPDNPPQERSVCAVMVGGGFSGGDVHLIVDPPPSTLPPQAWDGWLNIKKGDWLMLRGLDGTPPWPIIDPLDHRRVVVKWYRVVAVGDEVNDVTEYPGTRLDLSPSLRGRYVTLAGADWSADTDRDGAFNPVPPASSTASFDWVEATLVDNVVGVYTSTIIVGQ